MEAPPDFLSGLAAEGILLIAIHAGVDARLPDLSTNAVGAAHTSSEKSAQSTVVVAVDDTIDAYRDDPAFRSLASYDPISPEQRAFHVRFDIEAHRAFSGPNADLAAWLATHKSEIARLRKLDEQGPAIDVFLKTA